MSCELFQETRLRGTANALRITSQHRVSDFHLVDATKPGHRRFIALWLVDPCLRIISTANVPPQQQSWWVESVFGRSAKSQQAALAKLPVELVQLLKENGLTGEAQLGDLRGKLPRELLQWCAGISVTRRE